MNSELSIVVLIQHASPLVQAIMALLMLISIGSWTTIFRKWFQIRGERHATDRFEDDFWKDRDLAALFNQVRDGRYPQGSLARIFEAGMGEFLKVRQQKPGDVGAMIDGVYIREALKRGAPDGTAAADLVLGYLERELEGRG